MGRCADYILRDMKPTRIFVYADIDSRVRRCIARNTDNEHEMTEKQIRKHILSTFPVMAMQKCPNLKKSVGAN